MRVGTFALHASLNVAVAFASTACRNPKAETFVGAGVTVTSEQEHATRLQGGAIEAWALLAGPVVDEPNVISSVRLDGSAARGPIAIQASQNRQGLTFAYSSVNAVDGAPVLWARAKSAGVVNDLSVALDPRQNKLEIALRSDAASTSEVGLSTSMRVDGAMVLLDTGTPLEGHELRAARRSRYAIVDGPTPIVFASPQGLTVGGGDDPAVVTIAATPSDRHHASLSIALAHSMRQAEAIGASLGATAARTTIAIDLRAYDAATGAPLPARVWIESTPDDPNAEPVVWDPSRHAEPKSPIVDLDHGAAIVALIPGKYRFRATHGIGWSIEERTVTVDAGDSTRLAFSLHDEAPTHDFVGCDFHVHAEGSFDAREVTYEDRVRSLVSVGVGCAASTEHNAIGDFAPALKLRALDGSMVPIRGVEVTTNQPVFGHFNVFPWPGDAAVPNTTTTTPDLLFPAIHALPGEFVLQVNHPRMRAGGSSGTPIGYWDVSGYDVKRGVGTNAYSYRSDYDTIELFNGYQLDHLGDVHAMIDEWLSMIDRVVNPEMHVATGNSDSHWLTYPWAGFPRTFVATDSATYGAPSTSVTPASIAHALKLGRAWVSSGPVLSIHVIDAKGASKSLGDTASGPGLEVVVDVQLTSWCSDPKLDLRLGTDRISAPLVADDHHAGHFTATVALTEVKRRRALVAIVDAALSPIAKGMTGMQATLAFTNPIWIAP